MRDNVENARITKASLSMADHGVLVFNVTVEGYGWGCGIGTYVIGHGYLGAKQWDATGNGLIAMMKIMDVVGVEKWEDLKGNYIRVGWDHTGCGGKIISIGNIIKDKWFDIREFFAEDWGGTKSVFDERTSYEKAREDEDEDE